MEKFIKNINFILIRLFNIAIFSKFSKDILNEKSKKFENKIYYICGYYKHYDINDWRFSENNQRKNIKYHK